MEIYLIRHGIAAERGTYTDDEQRPLIGKGINKTTKVAESLFKKGIQFNTILSSPLTRAYQTAEIFKKAGLCQTIQPFLPLKPNGNIQEWLNCLDERKDKSQYNSLALVGHQPDLGNWAEMLVWGEVKDQIVVKKAGIIGLSLPDVETPISHSTLFLLSSPKWII